MSPIHSEVPSKRRLIKATAVALAAAFVILMTTVLPAEYGIDPTGIGGLLGLDALAQTTAAPEASASAQSPAEPQLDAVGQPLKPVDASSVRKRQGTYRTDTLSLTLPPGKGAEIKAQMLADDGLVFRWTATAAIAVDMHGERTGASNNEYTSYWIEPAQREASGSFTAPFDGTHGWYWLNRGTEPVTVQVEVTGFQQKLFFPGHP